MATMALVAGASQQQVCRGPLSAAASPRGLQPLVWSTAGAWCFKQHMLVQQAQVPHALHARQQSNTILNITASGQCY